MGEKIRDIHPIKIGKSSLMIELNEGYTPSDGRLIHIQNEKYRYLLKESEFCHLCAMIMRSWSEFKYIKDRKIDQRCENDFEKREAISDSTHIKLKELCRLFELDGICYRVLDIQNKLITIVVRTDDISAFEMVIKNYGGKKEHHPFCERNGYVFLYLMEPFQLYKIENIYVEVFCQIPCASLTPKNWIPLDRTIQSRLWENSDYKDDVLWADLIIRYIYHLCWAIFHNNGFSIYERRFLSENKCVLDNDESRQCLLKVFFRFTDSLINYLRNDEFDMIVPNYYKFIEY